MNTKETSMQVPEDQNSDLSKNADLNKEELNQDESTQNETKQDNTNVNTLADKDKPIGNPAILRPTPPRN